MFALKIKFPSTRRWEREPKSFKLTEIKKGTQPGGKEKGWREGKQRKSRKRKEGEGGRVTHHHKTVQSLIKIRKEERRSGGERATDALGGYACTGPAGGSRP